MNWKKHILIMAAVAGCGCAAAQELDTVPKMKTSIEVIPGLSLRLLYNNSLTNHLLTTAWENPAVKQWERDYSLSEVGVRYGRRDENRVIDVQQGNNDVTTSFDAQTYMKHGTSTLWGRAFYDNGRIRGINWNETSEPATVFPYLLADSVGGKMNVERYSFMGGWANYNGRWAIGASLGYTAGLYYRSVDPRPRNVTARLEARLGAGYTIAKNYVAAVGLNYTKYKQTNNVAFYSELGQDKLFHLTGFANDYSRFAGTGAQTYYNGNRFGASLNLHPVTNRGFSASVAASHFGFNKIITQLNKLPLAHVSHNELTAEAGWLAGTSWGAKAFLNASRRVGTENIFGDPAASVYNRIGELKMYYRNTFTVGVSGSWDKHMGGVVALSLQPTLAYTHLNEIYADPAAIRQINEMLYGLRVRGQLLSLNHVHLAITLSVDRYSPTSSEFSAGDGVKAELAGLERALQANFNYLSHSRTALLGQLDATWLLRDKYGIRLSLGATRTAFTASTHRNELQSSLSLIF